MKLRKNETKVRKNEIISPKSFSISRWKMKSLHRGILRFPLIET